VHSATSLFKVSRWYSIPVFVCGFSVETCFDLASSLSFTLLVTQQFKLQLFIQLAATLCDSNLRGLTCSEQLPVANAYPKLPLGELLVLA